MTDEPEWSVEHVRDDPDFDVEAYVPAKPKLPTAESLARVVANIAAARQRAEAKADPEKAARVEKELAAYHEHMREVSACRSHHTPLEFAVIAWHVEPWRRLVVTTRSAFEIWRDQFANYWIAADDPHPDLGRVIVLLREAGFAPMEVWHALKCIPEFREGDFAGALFSVIEEGQVMH